MRIEELSVGDWVRTTDDDIRGSRECIIQSIERWSNGDVLVVRFKDGGIETLGIGCFAPIPLTTEILEKNGFVKNGEYDEWNIGTWETPYLLGVSLERPAITIKWNGSSVFIDQAKCVHQLQHALRLAGVEKEIVL